MTEDDLNRIQSAIGIRLPVEYRNLVVPFPIPAYAGNADTELWDDADALIEFNRKLRTGYHSAAPWPEHMFAIGRDGSGCANAIDLRDQAGPVWWTDRCHWDAPGTALESPSLAAWVEVHLADMRVDLEEKGITEAGPPSARTGARSDLTGCAFILAIVGGGGFLMFAAWFTTRLLAR